MKAIPYLLLTILLFSAITSRAWDTDKSFDRAFDFSKAQLEAMLAGDEAPAYEEAIYHLENAWWGGCIDYVSYKTALQYHTDNIKLLAAQLRAGNVPPRFTRDMALRTDTKAQQYEQLLLNYAIYLYLTTPSLRVEGDDIYYTPAAQYATTDPMGTADWTNTQVTNLLDEGTGNCFALASLYKIYAERLGTGAELCTAPGHIYIRHADEQGSLHNIELTGKDFPGTGSIEAVTYSTATGIKKGVALRALDGKQQAALALVYLAKAREHRLGMDNAFALGCAEAALQYDTLNLNAMLLKAEAMEAGLLATGATIAELQGTAAYTAYEEWLGYIYALGYREMPYDMKNVLVQGWMRQQQQLPEPAIEQHYVSTTGGMFAEEIKEQRLQRYGRTVYDTETGRIMSFAPGDILYNQYNFDPVVFAWNMDPEVRPGRSPYEVFRYNPVLNIDPLGNIDGNYYNSKGTLVATDDDPDDGKVYLVADNKEARKLKKSDDVIKKGSVKSAIELPEYSIRSEIYTEIKAEDKNNPYRESGGFFGKDENGIGKVIWNKPGPEFKTIDEYAHIDAVNPSKESNPDGIGWNRLLIQFQGMFHSHPSGARPLTRNNDIGGTTTMGGESDRVIGQTISTLDLKTANEETVKEYFEGPHYMLSPLENKVEIYNEKGILGTIPMDKFGTIK